MKTLRLALAVAPLLFVQVACQNSTSHDRTTKAARPYNAQKGQFEDPQTAHKTSPGDATR